MKEVKNKYKCPNTLWKKMSENQKRFYNDMRVYDKSMVCSIRDEISDEVFDVIAHNYSYLASCLI